MPAGEARHGLAGGVAPCTEGLVGTLDHSNLEHGGRAPVLRDEPGDVVLLCQARLVGVGAARGAILPHAIA
eukprot:9657647-Lingulodinium_polyedra.AAC.1